MKKPYQKPKLYVLNAGVVTVLWRAGMSVDAAARLLVKNAIERDASKPS